MPIGLLGHINSNSLFQVRSPSCTTLNFPKVITLPTDWAFSVGSGACGLKLAHDVFGAPAPGAPASGVLSTCPAEDTMRQSRPETGTMSPGFTTVCFDFA